MSVSTEHVRIHFFVKSGKCHNLKMSEFFETEKRQNLKMSESETV